MVLLAVCERFRALRRLPGHPSKLLVGDFSHSVERAASSKPMRRSPKAKQKHRRASHAERTGSKSGEGGHRENFRGRGQGAVKRRTAWTKSCPVLLTAGCVNKTGQLRWLRPSYRMGRVRGSVRVHGAQMRRARKGSAERSPTPSTARYDALHWRQARADALTPDASAWRAVEMICATARGSDVSLGLRGAVSMPASCTSRHRLCANTSSLDTSIDIRVR